MPAAFGSRLGFTVGLPLMLNPVFILPSILIPLINMTIAVAAISLHIIPVCVYQNLKGTPGLLVSFLALTAIGQRWFYTIVVFIRYLLLLPVIKINEKVELRIKKQEMK
ncbi:hypothetical protein SDC49_04605 [Lactobacillus sp. R2/2]|nr:hypothetical protein [Lactobacillus sp. R2/2]